MRESLGVCTTDRLTAVCLATTMVRVTFCPALLALIPVHGYWNFARPGAVIDPVMYVPFEGMSD